LFEDLAIYRIKINYLEDWKVYFLSDVQRLRGDVAFAPMKDDGREWRIVLSWRPLENVRKKYSSVEAQAKETIKQLAKGKQVKSFEIIDHKVSQVNGHETIFYNLIVKYYKRGGLLKQNIADCIIRFLLLHCPESDRCMILYEESDYPIEQERIFEDVIKSFDCHSPAR
jgi:hypothetical protein